MSTTPKAPALERGKMYQLYTLPTGARFHWPGKTGQVYHVVKAGSHKENAHIAPVGGFMVGGVGFDWDATDVKESRKSSEYVVFLRVAPPESEAQKQALYELRTKPAEK